MRYWPFFAPLMLFLLLPPPAGADPGDVSALFKSPGACPTGLAWDGNFLWIADRKADCFFRVDPGDGSFRGSIPAPGYWPMGLAWDGKYLWNVDSKDCRIYRVDPVTGNVNRSFLTHTPSPQGLAWDGQALWLSDDKEDRIYKLDPEDGTSILDFPSPSGNPQGLAWDGRYLWVSDRVRDEIYMVNPEDGEVIVTFDAPGPYSWGLAWDGSNLWNVDYQKDQVYRLVVWDDKPYSLKKEREATVVVTHQFRNFGPGEVSTVDVYLSVPEDLPNQKIVEKVSFQPEPKEFLTDRWGQRVAHFHYEGIPGSKFLTSAMEVHARVQEIRYTLYPERVGKLEEIPAEIKGRYLEDAGKFRLQDPFIKKTVEEVVGAEKNPYWIARKLYNHVIEKVEYEMVGGWNTAPAVLKRGTGSCSEYSFVYIALCRAAGLPARYAGSVVVRGDDASLDDVFHRWVEVYLPNYGWIPVDPSRGDKPTPRDRADSFGHLTNSFLITTRGGGDSEYLKWDYNFHEEWVSQVHAKVDVEGLAEWEPAGEKK